MLEDLRYRKFSFFALVAIVISVALFVIGSISGAQRDFLSKGPGGTELPTAENAAYVQSASTTGDSSGQTNSSTSTTSRTPLAPFRISAVTLQGTSWKCGSGKVTLLITSARVDAASTAGGTFKWQLEVTGSSIPYSPLNSSVSMTKGQNSFNLIGGNPGYLYSSADARDGQSVRVHITAPNDISSTLFTVPAGTEAACAKLP